MPTAGLSLVGFMDEAQALQHLRNQCVPQDACDAALTAEWNAAQVKLGTATQNAGAPDMQPLPPTAAQHSAALLSQQTFQGAQGITLQLVEIEPLLAFQFTVDTARAAHHCASLSSPPTLDEMLHICLPLATPQEPVQIIQGPQSMLLKSRSLNIRALLQGMVAPQVMGVHFGVSLPHTQVVRHNGRCYLHNGFHRAYGIRKAGATHMPCIVRDVPDHAAAGINAAAGATFGAPLLESANPPTLAHFTAGRAYPVSLKAVSRVLHVSWSDYVVPEED
jgi:hypothetical protein